MAHRTPSFIHVARGAALAGLLCLGAAILQGQTAGQRPPAAVPADNPQTAEKIALGAQLFFDPRLSADNTISCATCHDPNQAWANHAAVDSGIGGKVGTRNSGTILDAAHMRFQFWDGRAASLEEQALGPIENPVEMGETLERVVSKLKAIAAYRSQFKVVFGTDVTPDGIAKAIAAFERTVVSGAAPYDRYLGGEASALSPAAARGLTVFRGKGGCASCHSGPMLSDQSFHNVGVGMNAAKPDIGREAVTQRPADRGRFKTPTLRNVALTWPYLHDGSARTLEDVIEFYNKGGEANPNLDARVRPLNLSASEKADLKAFLEALNSPLPKIATPKPPSRTGPTKPTPGIGFVAPGSDAAGRLRRGPISR